MNLSTENNVSEKPQFKLFEKLSFTNNKLKEEILIRKNTEINLIHSEEKYRSIISNMELGLVEVNINDVIINVNDRLLNMTGYLKNELIGEKYIDTFLKDSSRKTMEEENLKRKDGRTGVYEVKLKKKNGDWLWIIISGAPLYDVNKNVIGTIGAHLDITERKLMEEELLKAKDLAEEVAKTKTHFLANMSHEVRTPMNGIIGLTKLLLNTELTKKQKEYLNAIDISSNTLLTVVNDILDISKIEAGKMRFEQKEFKLVNLISSVVDVFEAKAAEKQIELVSLIDKDIPENIIGDSIRLNQILYNLMNNAIKFTPKGKVTVKIDQVAKANNIITLNIAIIDTGIGIQKENLQKIFDVFTQEKDDTTRKYGGTGLGLTIVKKIVELQGGTIKLESEPEKGSTFSVELDFEVPLNNDNNVGVIEQHSEQFDDYPELEGLNVLFAEDNSINQLLVNDLLSDIGAHVKIVDNGQDALNFFNTNHYDIILMDMQMPIMDGYDAIKQIREKGSEIPIIALTAHATDGEKEKCIVAGADNYLSKPFQPHELLGMIKNMTKDVSIPPTEEDNLIEHFNIKTLQEFTNNKTDLIRSTLLLLDETLSEDKNRLISAYHNKEIKTLKSIAHKMKPNFYLLGLSNLGETCDEICLDETAQENIYSLSNTLATTIPHIILKVNNELDLLN